MKTSKILYLWVLSVMLGLAIHGCSKDNMNGPGSSSAITSSDISVAQDQESQDAIVDQVNMDADNSLDLMEANNFNLSATKSASDCSTVTISPKDTIVFPKTITITYNCVDTVNGEYMTQTGQLVILIDTIPVGKKLPWRAHLKRSITFVDFKVTTDSSSFTINGTRTLYRMASTSKTLNSLNKRTEVKDSIASRLTLNISNGSSSLVATRNSNRTRDAINYYNRLTTTGYWHPEVSKDTIIFTGTIFGVNTMGNNYSRTITTPFVYTHCPFWPYNIVIPSGAINFTVGTNTLIVSYSADGCKTTITITKNGKTRIINRRIGRKFYPWWRP
ncbi:MAG TPA: hypothetical protein VIH57_06965 [Bacteroidales bacterium]